MRIEPFGQQHKDALAQFVAGLGPGDLAFIKEDIADESIRADWAEDPNERRWVVRDDGSVIGFGALMPLTGWSAHVGEIRIVAHPQHRRKGVGRALTQHLLKRAIETGLRKVVVEVVSGDDGTMALFQGLGFRPEALLVDHILDRDGQTRDLVVLAHDIDEVKGMIATIGAAEPL